MKAVLPFLLLLACASCQRESETKPKAASQAPAKSRPLLSSAEHPSSLQPLIDTPRITVSPGGGSAIKGDVAIDADAILADLRSIPASSNRDQVIARVLGQLAAIDPIRARSLLAEWKDGLASEWIKAAQAVASGLARTDPASARDFVGSEVPAGLRVDVWGSLLAALPAKDRSALLEEVPEGQKRIRMAGSMIHEWIFENPTAVARWLDGFASGKAPRELQTLNEPWGGMPTTNPDPLVWLAAFHAAKTPEAQRYLAEKAYLHANAGQREQWRIELSEAVPSLDDGKDRHPWAANPGEWIASQDEARIDALRVEDVRDLIERWGQKNPRKALDWALSRGRPEAARLLDQLYYQDPKDALAMAPSVQEGKDRDDVISTICQMAVNFGDRDMARKFLPLISDPQQREFIGKQIER